MIIKEFKPKFDYEIQSLLNDTILMLKSEEYNADEHYLSEEINNLVKVNNLLDEKVNLQQENAQLKEQISKTIEYCNGSAFEVSTREWGMLTVVNHDDIMEILESNKED